MLIYTLFSLYNELNTVNKQVIKQMEVIESIGDSMKLQIDNVQEMEKILLELSYINKKYDAQLKLAELKLRVCELESSRKK